jgi:hypothetical protein
MVEDKAVTQPAADRFASTFADFVRGIRKTLEVAPGHPSTPRWRRKGLPLLEHDLAEVDAAMKEYRVGEQRRLLHAASSAMSLAKKMDGFPLDLAGEESANQLAEQRRFVVMAAWQVLNGPGAA